LGIDFQRNIDETPSGLLDTEGFHTKRMKHPVYPPSV